MLANYSKVDSTRQERDRITREFSYEDWLIRMNKPPPQLLLMFPTSMWMTWPNTDTIVQIELMRPGATSWAADTANPLDTIGVDRMEEWLINNGMKR